MSITYTFPAHCPVTALRGVTCTGGRVARARIGKDWVDVVAFGTRVNGLPVSAIIQGKPDLRALVDAEIAAELRSEDAKKAALESAVPGIGAYEAAMSNYANAAADYECVSDRGYPAREAATLHAAQVALDAVHAQYPATRLYREIEGYRQAANYAKSHAGDVARAAVLAGHPIADAVAAMRAQWSVDARRAVENS